MSFNTKWDVDQYKTEHESVEHWELRRNFMVVHKDKFPEERLVCLAQVFCNVEFLGCRYPAETMQLVAELSEGVVEAYREKQKTKLQRTFVKASDAAGAKVKGLKRAVADAGAPSDVPPKITKCSDDSQLFTANVENEETEQKNINEPNIDCIVEKHVFNCDSPDLIKTLDPKLNPEAETLELLEISCIGDRTDVKSVNREVTAVPRLKQKTKRKLAKEAAKIEDGAKWETVSAGIFGRLVLIEEENDNHGNVLARSTSICGIPYHCVCEEGITGEVFCKVFVNSHLLTTANGSNHKTARLNSYRSAYEKLKQICYTLKVKQGAKNGPVIDRDLELKYPFDSVIDVKPSVSGTDINDLGNSVDKPLTENIGTRLMRSMGWSGGGLGKNQQGIEEPVGMSTQVKRTGLGHTSEEKPIKKKRGGVEPQFEAKFRELLGNYKRIDGTYDLYFSSLFSKAERAMMHIEAFKSGLKSKSFGKDDDRYLVISKKKDLCKIVENMLRSEQTFSSQYELIKPSISLSLAKESEVSVNDNPRKSEDVTSTPSEHLNPVPPDISRIKRDPETETPPLSIIKREPYQEIPDLSIVKKESSPLVSTVQQPNQETGLGKSNTLNLCGENLEQDKISQSILPNHRHYVHSEQFGNLVLIEDENCTTPSLIIEKSANGCHIPFRYEYSHDKSKMVCELFMNGVVLASASGSSKKFAREMTVTNGLEKLREVCYTLRTQVVKVGENNIKFIKTLRLPYKKRKPGKGKQSGSNIVCTSQLIDRNCLGIEKEEELTKNKIRNYLQDYISQIWPYDLITTPDFSSEDTWLIHRIASSLSLKANFQKISQKDFLILSKKLSPVDTAVAMLLGDGQISESV